MLRGGLVLYFLAARGEVMQGHCGVGMGVGVGVWDLGSLVFGKDVDWCFVRQEGWAGMRGDGLECEEMGREASEGTGEQV